MKPARYPEAERCAWCRTRAAFRLRVLIEGRPTGRWACELHISEARKLRVAMVARVPHAKLFEVSS